MQSAPAESTMQGYQLTFITQQDRRHRGHPLAEWLLEECRRLGLGGATLIAAAEGYGRHRKIHSAHFIELADQPVEVTMAVDAGECERVFALLRQEGIDIFYIKAPIEFGMTAGA
jgi:PII-like signaling protein